jgi:hypothetical protein
MEKPALLMAVHPVVGGVKIEDQPLGRLAEGGDELLHEHLMHGHGTLAVGALFESAEGWAGGERGVAMDGSLPEEIVAEGIVVVEILVALGESEDALTQELLPSVGDEGRMSVIVERPTEILDQAEAFFELTQEDQTAVAGDVAPFERGLDFPTIQAGKKELAAGTVWHWRGFFGLVCKTHNHSSLLRKPRQYFALMRKIRAMHSLTPMKPPSLKNRDWEKRNGGAWSRSDHWTFSASDRALHRGMRELGGLIRR